MEEKKLYIYIHIHTHIYTCGGIITKSCLTPAIPWTVTCPTPLSMGFPGKNTRMGCHFLLSGICPTQGLNRRLQPMSLAP